ncbi:hypothetical protein TI03_04905, partial [Achromatium sp. WMS1]
MTDITELQATDYGELEIISGIKIDSYVLNNGLTVLSERGAADLLYMDHMAFRRVETKWPPKVLKPFINGDFSVEPKRIMVIANNSPHKGRYITVYDSHHIGSCIRAYALALAHRKLRPNQIHIGERCVILQASLVETALDVTIREACGLPVNIQATSQKNYADVVKVMQELGLKCSVSDEIAIKTDITNFLDISPSTLAHFLNKHRDTIQPIKLNRQAIRALNSKASHMNGYKVQDVGTIALGLDTVKGIEVKERLFGNVSRLTKWETKGEIEWQQILAAIFAGFTFYHNYQIGRYRVDFYIPELN